MISRSLLVVVVSSIFRLQCFLSFDKKRKCYLGLFDAGSW